MRAIIFGDGWLGNRLRRPGSPFENASLCRGFDISDRTLCLDVIRNVCLADVVVNAAGKTGRPNVDWCESHQEETYRANVVGALTLASACAEAGAHLVHLGSGCVFYGRSPNVSLFKTRDLDRLRTYFPDFGWRESDHANPKSFYSRTKYAADLVLSQLPNVAVVRLRMPVDGEPHPRNLITKLAGYRQVADVENSVTVVGDLARALWEIAERRATGIFHAVNPGAISHRQILALYREIVDPSHRCEWISEADLVERGLALAPRSNCLLADTRLAEMGIAMRPVEEAVRAAMVEYAKTARLRRGDFCGNE